MRTAGYVAIGLVAVVALAVGGWFGGWWLQEDATNRRTGIANESLARQQARLDEVTDTAGDIGRIDVQLATATPEQAEPIAAQRLALVEKFCDAYGGLTDRLAVPASSESLYLKEC